MTDGAKVAAAILAAEASRQKREAVPQAILQQRDIEAELADFYDRFLEHVEKPALIS